VPIGTSAAYVLSGIDIALILFYASGKYLKEGCLDAGLLHEMPRNEGYEESEAITMKNGKPANQGACPSCGTKIFKIGKA